MGRRVVEGEPMKPAPSPVTKPVQLMTAIVGKQYVFMEGGMWLCNKCVGMKDTVLCHLLPGCYNGYWTEASEETITEAIALQLTKE